MIPDTVGALVAFLGLIIPGLVFELLRERRRQGFDDSAFREASRTAISSLAFTTAALVLLGLVRLVRPDWVIDLGDWVLFGKTYFAENTTLVFANAIAAVAISASLAVLFDRILAKGREATIVHGNIWFYLFRTQRPPDKTTRVAITLKNGDRLFGYVDRYSTARNVDEADLYLVGPGLTWMRAPTDASGQSIKKDLDDHWDGIYVRASEISWFRMGYLDREQPSTQPETSARR